MLCLKEEYPIVNRSNAIITYTVDALRSMDIGLFSNLSTLKSVSFRMAMGNSRAKIWND